MSQLPLKLQEQADKYSSLTDKEKRLFISKAYNDKDLSFDVIAKACGTYKNKIIRDAKRLNAVEPRSKSSAQKLALSSGRQEHPTEGKEVSEHVKDTISKKMVDNWKGLSKKEREDRSKLGKQQWDNKSRSEQQQFIKQGNKAVRKAAKSGSKLEKFLNKKLTYEGYKTTYHKEHLIFGTKLHVDILIPALNIAIEVDGISHSSGVWGTKTFMAASKADTKKNGLLLGKGLVIIRVKHPKKLSRYSMDSTWNSLKETVESVKESFPEAGKRLIKLEEEE